MEESALLHWCTSLPGRCVHSFFVRILRQQGFPGGSDGKVSAHNVGDLDSIPESGRFPGEGNGNTLQYPSLESPMGGGDW